MVTTKKDRAEVPLGKIQPEPRFVVGLIGRASVSFREAISLSLLSVLLCLRLSCSASFARPDKSAWE